MKSITTTFVVLALLGAGCTAPSQTSVTPFQQVSTAEARLCTDPPTENEAGRAIYPIAEKYKNLPHLGQILTAIDCNDADRAKHVAGFNADGKYTAGILLKWKEGGASGQIREALRKLGFTEPDKKTMRSDYPYSIDDLRSLRDILNDPDAVQALDREDCIVCG